MRTKRKGLILASASPRRAELLTRAGIDFEVVASPAAEPHRKPAGIPVELWPMCLAYLKATAVREKFGRRADGRLILAADTIVVIDEKTGPKILNKPADRAHARRMMQLLSGRTHRVITGICLMSNKERRLSSAQATCRVSKFTPARLQAYLDSGLWKGKAGAYGIQDRADPFVTLVEGDMTTVMGLPMSLVKSELKSFGKD